MYRTIPASQESALLASFPISTTVFVVLIYSPLRFQGLPGSGIYTFDILLSINEEDSRKT
jgi:hypothetical protein